VLLFYRKEVSTQTLSTDGSAAGRQVSVNRDNHVSLWSRDGDAAVATAMGAIWWGAPGTSFQTVGTLFSVSPHLYFQVLYLERFQK